MDGIRTLSIWWVVIGHIVSETVDYFSNVTPVVQYVYSGGLSVLISATVR
jgi:hypothetical protein